MEIFVSVQGIAIAILLFCMYRLITKLGRMENRIEDLEINPVGMTKPDIVYLFKHLMRKHKKKMHNCKIGSDHVAILHTRINNMFENVKKQAEAISTLFETRREDKKYAVSTFEYVVNLDNRIIKLKQTEKEIISRIDALNIAHNIHVDYAVNNFVSKENLVKQCILTMPQYLSKPNVLLFTEVLTGLIREMLNTPDGVKKMIEGIIEINNTEDSIKAGEEIKQLIEMIAAEYTRQIFKSADTE